VRPRAGLPASGPEGSHPLGSSRVGTPLYFDLEAPSPEAAVDAAEALCRRTLADPVVEDFDVFPATEGAGAGP
jgi:phosphoribosylformylglycinamidine (FGAM) synthase PurS component